MRSHYVTVVLILVSAAVPLLLISCGGGGGESGISVTPPSSPPPPQPVVQASYAQASVGINYQHGYVDNGPIIGSDLAVQRFSGGVAAGDYDGDGDVDLFIVRGDIGPNLLYQNDGNGLFTDVAATAGLDFTESATTNYAHSGPTFADMDGDGDLDLFIGGILGDPSFIFANNGDGTFTDVSATAGIDPLRVSTTHSISAAFGDYDLDGDMDMFVAHWGTERIADSGEDTASLFRNDSDADGIRYTNVSVESGISATLVTSGSTQPTGNVDLDYTFAPTFARINDDLYPDIVIAGDFLTSRVYINNQDGTFTDVTDPAVITDNNGMGSALGDFDNDGDLDWLVTAIYAPETRPDWTGNRFYRNDNGVFVDSTEEHGLLDGGWGWAACFLDFENDGDLDIYHTNGYPEFRRDDVSRAFVSSVSEGSTHFAEQAESIGLGDREDGRAVVCADFDRDGDVDILQLHRSEISAASYYRNDSSGNNYLTVKLNGRAPNTQAAGARIFATIGDTTQMREIMIGSNFTSQNPTDQVFGLGASSQVDTLRVEWPDGAETVLTNVQAVQKLEIDQPPP